MIPNYWWRTHKVLPTVYDESLSYCEVLNKITYHINQIVQSIEEFEENVTEQVTDISELVTNIRNDVDELNTRCSALEALTGQHTTQINTNTSDITSLKTRTTALENRTTTQGAEISTLGQQVSDIDNRLIAAEGNISDHTQQINALDERVDNLEAEYISINCADLSEITFSGSVDYTQVAVYINNAVTYFYQFGQSRTRIQPFNYIAKRGDSVKIIISCVGSGGSAVTLSKTLRINVDGASKLTLPSIPWNGTANTYTLNLNDTDFNSELRFHNIDISA